MRADLGRDAVVEGHDLGAALGRDDVVEGAPGGVRDAALGHLLGEPEDRGRGDRERDRIVDLNKSSVSESGFASTVNIFRRIT